MVCFGKEGKFSLPEKTRQEPTQKCWAYKARWLVLENRFKQVVGVFVAAGVQVIPLKGAALLGLLYKDSGLRGLMRTRPDSPSLAKAEGMVRFFLEGKKPLEQQTWPQPLLQNIDALDEK